MTQDERLIPARAGRELDRSLADFATAKPYERYGAAGVETSLLDLPHNPNFLGGRANSGLFNSLKYLFSRTKIAPAPAPAASSGEQTITQDELIDKVNNLTPEEVVRLEPYEDAITANEEVDTVEKTNLVSIRYHHSDPALA